MSFVIELMSCFDDLRNNKKIVFNPPYHNSFWLEEDTGDPFDIDCYFMVEKTEYNPLRIRISYDNAMSIILKFWDHFTIETKGG